jgi:hypothetical protein
MYWLYEDHPIDKKPPRAILKAQRARLPLSGGPLRFLFKDAVQ